MVQTLMRNPEATRFDLKPGRMPGQPGTDDPSDQAQHAANEQGPNREVEPEFQGCQHQQGPGRAAKSDDCAFSERGGELAPPERDMLADVEDGYKRLKAAMMNIAQAMACRPSSALANKSG